MLIAKLDHGILGNEDASKDDENVFTAVADILFSLPPKKAIEQIKKWRHI